MNKTLLILFFVCLNYSVFAQDSMFSGLFVRPKMEGTKSKETLNFNPALRLGRGEIPMVYHNVLSQSYTLFYVYKEKKGDSLAPIKRESPFLEMHYNGRIYKATSSFFSGDNKFFIQANHRFNGTMVSHFGSFTPLKVGSKLQANLLFLYPQPSIELYEVIVFSSVLSALDYAKLHSYLAIKYSIPLPESFDYITPSGDVLWNAKENSSYNARIMGLGREDALALKQYQSKAYKNNFLTIGLNDALQSYASEYTTREIEDKSYVLVGDNNGSLTFEKKNGQEQLNRKWKIVNHQVKTDLHFFFQRQEIEGNKESESQPNQSYDYYASVSTKEHNALATLIPLELKNDTLLHASVPLHNAPKYMSIIRKQKVDFDLNYRIDCDGINFKLNLHYGKLPFTLKVETEEGTKTITSSTNTTEFSLPKDLVGNVVFVLEDVAGNKKRRTLDLFDIFISPSTVELNYFLPKEGSVTITPNKNVTEKQDLKYQWYDAQRNLISSEESITLKNTGNYTLIVREQENLYCSEFKVLKVLEDKMDYKLGLYPNPVEKLEEFVVYIPLDKIQDAEVLVYTNKGQLLDYKMYRNTPQILYKHAIATTGMYIIVVKTGEQKQLYRLMVK